VTQWQPTDETFCEVIEAADKVLDAALRDLNLKGAADAHP